MGSCLQGQGSLYRDQSFVDMQRELEKKYWRNRFKSWVKMQNMQEQFKMQQRYHWALQQNGLYMAQSSPPNNDSFDSFEDEVDQGKLDFDIIRKQRPPQKHPESDYIEILDQTPRVRAQSNDSSWLHSHREVIANCQCDLVRWRQLKSMPNLSRHVQDPADFPRVRDVHYANVTGQTDVRLTEREEREGGAAHIAVGQFGQQVARVSPHYTNCCVKGGNVGH